MALTSLQISTAGRVLARAFHDNPGFVALLPDQTPAQRMALCTPAMTTFVHAASRFGLVELIEQSAEVVAVALMFAPGRYPPPALFELMTAWPVICTGPLRALRFARLGAYMRKHHVRGPHWYLWFLGVNPEHQGQGLGSQLLRSLNQRAAKDGVPCYLETDKPSSVRLYERHGYGVQKQELVPGFGFDMWFMLQATPGGR